MRTAVLFLIIFSFLACKREKKEFTVIDENFSYKLLAFDEHDMPFEKDNFVRASIKLVAGIDTVFNKYELVPFNPKNTPFYNLIADLNEGDSICFKLNPNYLKEHHFNVDLTNDTLLLDGYIKIYEFLTIEKNDEFVAKNDPELIEQLMLTRYLKSFKNIKKRNGVYVSTIQKGQGISVESGKTLTLKYKASFIDGIEFDNTYYQNYFEYTYGTPNQIIEGLDVVLLGMKNKEKSKIIIPSQLAFGDKGSSTGIVPPFTTLVYELEIIDIK